VDDEIPAVRNPGEGVSEDDHGIFEVKQAIAQERYGTDEAQPPERLRHNDLLLFFRGIPLDEEAREKNGVAKPADDFPDAPINAEQFAMVPEKVLPDEMGQPIHNARSLTQRRKAAK
jgi:hypothetical protein